jgi:hypothetical protein
MKQHAHITPPRKGEGARTCTTADATADATVAARDAVLQQYSTSKQVRMRSNMAFRAPIGSKGVGIIAGDGTYLATQPPSTSPVQPTSTSIRSCSDNSERTSR